MKNSAQATHQKASETHARAVIWVDHLTAKIFSMGTTGVTPSVVRAKLASQHLHHKANSIGSGRAAEDREFLRHVAKAVEACREVLVLGPGTEKTTLLHHLKSVYPQMTLQIEACDHPTAPEIIALGRRHFHID